MVNNGKISTVLVALASLGSVNALWGFNTTAVHEAIDTDVNTAAAHEMIDVKDRYIVAFSPNISEVGIESHLSWMSTIHARSLSRRDTTGFEGRLDVDDDFHAYVGHYDEATVEELRNNPDVAYVEEDQWLSIAAVKTQTKAGWPLHSMANRQRADAQTQYFYDESAGEGTYAYVLDNGVEVNNPEFEGRAERGWSATGGKVRHFHGTAVAGLIASKTFGVAKKGRIVDVQVFSATGGLMSNVMRGIEWVVKNATTTPERKGRSVINMSLSGPVRPGARAVENLVKAATKKGVHVVVCAGNENKDARTQSPANSAYAITVGGINKDWNRWSHSNYGPVVDVHAPGEKVSSIGLKGATVQHSGTSFSSPHVAGLVMYLLGKQHAEGKKLSSPAKLKAHIVKTSTKNQIKGLKPNTPNRIAFNGAI